MLNKEERAAVNALIERSMADHKNRNVLIGAKEAVVIARALRRELDLGELTGQSAYEREILHWQSELDKFLNLDSYGVGIGVFMILKYGDDSDKRKINRVYPTAVFVWDIYCKRVQTMDKV